MGWGVGCQKSGKIADVVYERSQSQQRPHQIIVICNPLLERKLQDLYNQHTRVCK